jgi:hypothetical protein
MGGKGSGRKPKPTEVKRRLGNPGKRALPKAEVIALPTAQEAPEPKRKLLRAGLSLWEQIWTSGAVWLRPDMDEELCLMLCEMADEREFLRIHTLQNPDAWRERRALRELDRQITSMLGTIGFSPTDRARLGIGEVKQSEFADLHKRIAGKRAGSQ